MSSSEPLDIRDGRFHALTLEPTDFVLGDDVATGAGVLIFFTTNFSSTSQVTIHDQLGPHKLMSGAPPYTAGDQEYVGQAEGEVWGQLQPSVYADDTARARITYAGALDASMRFFTVTARTR